ncbi:hypothetical protein B0H63DRAFT_523553 [Podospora didyma]|uniref:Uncharacterized protein n=1 Tax=Podospora didyma TaxID=330526 RepID=A0AAE0TV65_9PEZI|nr:hypothetical protein B0H63DRAFT_523553 [Podospora didyma]
MRLDQKDKLFSDLDHALDEVHAGQVNQGAEKWESLYRNSRAKLDLTEALFLKAEFGEALFKQGWPDHGRQVYLEVCEELSADEESDYPLMSEANRSKLGDILSLRLPMRELSPTPESSSSSGSSCPSQEILGSGGDFTEDSDNTCPGWSSVFELPGDMPIVQAHPSTSSKEESSIQLDATSKLLNYGTEIELVEDVARDGKEHA